MNIFFAAFASLAVRLCPFLGVLRVLGGKALPVPSRAWRPSRFSFGPCATLSSMNTVPRISYRLLLLTFLCAQPALTFAQPAGGSAYPSRPVRLVVPFPPGASPNDIIGRLLGRPVGESLGQQIVVDNRAGAGGTIGT